MSKKIEILEVSRNIIIDKGYESFRLDDLLHKMSLSKGGFYHHFKSVESLLGELIKEDFLTDMEKIEEACSIACEKNAVIELFMVGSLNHGSEAGILKALSSDKNRQLYLLLMDEAWYKPFKKKLLTLLGRGIDNNAFPDIDLIVTCELFEAINRHANRSHVLRLWDDDIAINFHNAALEILANHLDMKDEFSILKEQVS